MSGSNPCQTQDDTVISMGARRKKKPTHIPMIHIENESMTLRQRPRSNTGDSNSRRSEDGINNGVAQLCDQMNEAFITPPNQRLNEAFITPPNQRLNDSGFHGDSPAVVHSDPDWYLRPRKLSQDLSKNSKAKRKFKRKGSDCQESLCTRTLQWLGLGINRQTFMDNRPRSSSPWFTMSMDTLLPSLVFIIIIASLLFTVLISMRFFEPRQGHPLNGKYLSMKFASEQREARIQQKEVVLRRPDPEEEAKPEQAGHIPRDDIEDDVEEEAKEDSLDYEDPSTFRGKEVPEETREVKPVVEVVAAANIEALKKIKAKKSKHRNPLKPKMTISSAKRKPRRVEEDSKDAPDSIENDYDDPPSNFRGKQPEVVDLLNDDL